MSERLERVSSRVLDEKLGATSTQTEVLFIMIQKEVRYFRAIARMYFIVVDSPETT